MPARRLPRPGDDAAQPLTQAAAVLLVAATVATVFVVAVPPGGTASASGMQTIGSREELVAFLEEHRIDRSDYGGHPVVADRAVSTADGASEAGSAGAADHSTTNVQVAGVDEADIVKNDGTHIYAVSEDRVLVVRAYPPSKARVVGEIPLPDVRPESLYLAGDRLVVLGSSRVGPPVPALAEGEPVDVVIGETSVRRARPVLPSSTVRVYDVADPAAPELRRNVTVHGGVHDSRRIDGHAYVVLVSPLRFDDDEPVVPLLHPDQAGFPEIRHFGDDAPGYRYTNVLSVPVRDDDAEVRNEAFLVGRTSELYASTSHLYLAAPQRAALEELPGLGVRSERTRIHKLSLDAGQVEHVASGEVPGRILDQFSMDEHDGHLRVATTVGHVSRSVDDGEPPSSNNLYVLDGVMHTVGRREGIAPGERIYSARFLGDRAYLVTFKKVDPFFVLDLSDPSDPTVLGELKLPGYSDYLHPIGDGKVIGIGKDTVAAESGDFAWYQGVKIAVFDASDVHDPKVADDLIIGDRGSDSAVLRDHKAFLYDPDRRMMVLPVLRAEVDASKYPDGQDPPPNTHGDPVWQGVHAIDVSEDGELSTRGTVTHGPEELERWGGRDRFVRRSLTMDDVLYTVSGSLVKANAIGDLSELARVELGRT